MNQLTPHQVLAMPAGDLALQTSESLFQLKYAAADLQALAKAVVDHLDRALDLKYSKQAHALRLAAGKDTGLGRDDAYAFFRLGVWLHLIDIDLTQRVQMLKPIKRGGAAVIHGLKTQYWGGHHA